MDVKHAGGSTIAGEIQSRIAQGYDGVTELWASLLPEGEIADFEAAVNKSTKLRLGKMDTSTIRKELEQLYEARGTEYSSFDLSRADRDELIDMAVKATGLESFFREMADQVREGAMEGILRNIEKLSPDKRAQIGDPKSYAKNLIQEEIAAGGINVREHITVPNLPLYITRQESNLKGQEKRFTERYGEPTVPQGVQFLRKKPKEQEELLKKYKQAKATARNIQDAIAEAAEGLDAGAYSQLVKSTLDNIHRDQLLIDDEFKKLQAEGFDITKVDRSLDALKSRVLLEEELPSLTRDILKKAPEDQIKEIEKLADLVGVPTLTREEKIDVSEKLLKDFRKHGEKLLSKDPDFNKEEVEVAAESYAQELAAKAEIVYEMDRILDVLSTRAKEGITTLSLFPEASDLSRPKATGQSARSYKFSQDMQAAAIQGQAMREEAKGIHGPGGSGTIYG